MTTSVDGIPSDGVWFGAQGGSDDEPTMIRGRSDLLQYLPAPGMSMRVIVRWDCKTPSESGLPSDEDYEDIKSFEDTLLAFVEEGAILAFVFTADSAVEYNFYTSDADWFAERFNEAFADKPPVPVELAAEHDPDWEEYRTLMQSVDLSAESQEAPLS